MFSFNLTYLLYIATSMFVGHALMTLFGGFILSYCYLDLECFLHMTAQFPVYGGGAEIVKYHERFRAINVVNENLGMTDNTPGNFAYVLSVGIAATAVAMRRRWLMFRMATCVFALSSSAVVAGIVVFFKFRVKLNDDAIEFLVANSSTLFLTAMGSFVVLFLTNPWSASNRELPSDGGMLPLDLSTVAQRTMFRVAKAALSFVLVVELFAVALVFISASAAAQVCFSSTISVLPISSEIRFAGDARDCGNRM